MAFWLIWSSICLPTENQGEPQENSRRRVLGSAGQPGANERIVLGIIGCGTRGNQLSDNIPAGAMVAAVADCDLVKVGKLADRHQAGLAVVHDYRRLLERNDLDAVMICPTDPRHVQDQGGRNGQLPQSLGMPGVPRPASAGGVGLGSLAGSNGCTAVQRSAARVGPLA